jgi:short-subunit dehydrogenase
MEHFLKRYGPWALVAGASHGIGAEFARQVAARGLDLVLVAREGRRLEETAARISDEHGVETRPIALDLAAPDMIGRLREEAGDLEIGLVVASAASAPVAAFMNLGLEEKLRIIDVNCRAPLILAHEYGRQMRDRGRGGIVIMSSLAAFQGTALAALYAATKAFDLVLGEGLWEEMRSSGVDVLVTCPGMTRTPTWESSRPVLGRLVPPVQEADEVVRAALGALGRKPMVVTGGVNRLAALAGPHWRGGSCRAASRSGWWAARRAGCTQTGEDRT